MVCVDIVCLVLVGEMSLEEDLDLVPNWRLRQALLLHCVPVEEAKRCQAVLRQLEEIILDAIWSEKQMLIEPIVSRLDSLILGGSLQKGTALRHSFDLDCVLLLRVDKVKADRMSYSGHRRDLRNWLGDVLNAVDGLVVDKFGSNAIAVTWQKVEMDLLIAPIMRHQNIVRAGLVYSFFTLQNRTTI